MAIFNKLHKVTALAFAAAAFLSLVVTGCSDSDRDRGQSVTETTITVTVARDTAATKGAVSEGTVMLAYALYGADGAPLYGFNGNIGDFHGCPMGGVVTPEWNSNNEYEFEIDVEDEDAANVKALMVAAFDADGTLQGAYGEPINVTKGQETEVDFTADTTSDYVERAELMTNGYLEAVPTVLIDDENTATIAVGDEVDVDAYTVVKFTTAAGEDWYAYFYECQDGDYLVQSDNNTVVSVTGTTLKGETVSADPVLIQVVLTAEGWDPANNDEFYVVVEEGEVQ